MQSNLEKLESVCGTIIAHDGRYCLWTRTGVHDLRDVAERARLSIDDAADALPVLEKVKRGRASLSVSDEEQTG